MTDKIELLTPEQEALIPVYREKWRRIALSTEPIDRQKAAETIKAIYKLIGREEPKIIFLDNPEIFLDERRIWEKLQLDKLRNIQSGEKQQELIFIIFISIVVFLITSINLRYFEKPLGLLKILDLIFLNSIFTLAANAIFYYFQQIDKRKLNISRTIGRTIKKQIEDKLRESIDWKWLNDFDFNLGDYLYKSLSNRQEIFSKNATYYLRFNREIDRRSPKLDLSISGGTKWNDAPMICPDLWALDNCLFDFCISVFNVKPNLEIWKINQAIVNNCGWIFPYEKICFVCDRQSTFITEEKSMMTTMIATMMTI